MQQLVDKTAALIDADVETIEKLRSATVERALVFGRKRFENELDRLMAGPQGED